MLVFGFVKKLETKAQSAVNKEIRACYVPSGVGAEQESGCRAIFGCADVPEGDIAFDGLLIVGVSEGVNVSGCGNPGARLFIVIPIGARRGARFFTRFTNPAFDAAYTHISLCGLACWTEPMFRILPQWFLDMCGTTSLIRRSVERKLTFIWASKSSSVTWSYGARTCIEAFATSMSAGTPFASENSPHAFPTSARTRSNCHRCAFTPNFSASAAVCSASLEWLL